MQYSEPQMFHFRIEHAALHIVLRHGRKDVVTQIVIFFIKYHKTSRSILRE